MTKGLFFTTGGIHLATMLGMVMELQNRVENPNVCGGISAGALLAAIIATHGVDEGVQIMQKHTKDTLLENRHGFFNTFLSVLFNESLVKSDHLQALVKQLLMDKPLKSDLYLGYTEENSMQYVSKKFKKGNLYKDLYLHVLASMSLPLYLPSTEIDGKSYIDGGLYHCLPIEGIQSVVKECTEKKEPLDLVVLGSKPNNYFIQDAVQKRHFFSMASKALHYMKGIEAIVIHNDTLLLREILGNAKAHQEHVNLSYFHLKQKHVAFWDKKIPFENYGKISKEDVEKLVNLGRSIVSESLKTNLKF